MDSEKAQMNKSDGEIKKELEQCQKKADEYLNGWKRAKADYLNLKKDFEKEKEELVKFASAAVILGLLPILDNFKKALNQIPKDQQGSGWLKGVQQIKKQFDDFLKKIEIEEIKTIGEKFNPEFHEAVSRQKKEGTESDMILEEVGGGYKMHGKTIVPAKVIVAE